MIIYCCTSAPVFLLGEMVVTVVWMDAVNGARIVTSEYENYCSVEKESKRRRKREIWNSDMVEQSGWFGLASVRQYRS